MSNNPLSIPLVGFYFFLCAIFVMPIDSFPIFPISTVNRPISIFFLIIPLGFYFLRGRLHWLAPWIFISIAFILIHTTMMTYFLFDENKHLYKSALTLLLFFILLVTLFTVINDGLKKPDFFFNGLGNASFYSLLLIISVAFVQLLMKIGVIPVSLSDQVTYFFSYRSSQRIQSVSGEPSQMVRSVLLLFIMVYFFYSGKYKKIILKSSFILLFLSGSTYGYLTIVFIIFFYIIFFKPKFLFNFKFLLSFLLLSLIFFLLRDTFFDEYTNNKLDAVFSILISLDSNVVNNVLQTDGSIFQRAMNPMIGFISGPYSNFLGVGLDGYRYVYPLVINDYFSYAKDFSTVAAAVNGENYITPKSLYSKVFSELGLLPFILFVLYYIWIYLSILKKKNDNHLLKILFVYVLVIPLNSDSIIYFNYFFALTLLHLLILNRSETRSYG